VKYIDYRKKLGLGFDDTEKANRVMSQIHNYLDNESIVFSRDDEIAFCDEIGVQAHEEEDVFNMDFSLKKPSGLQIVWQYLKDDKNLTSFISKYVVLINTYQGAKANRNKLLKKLESVLVDCEIGYEILTDSDGVFVFPKGAQELDNALVSEPLGWLNAYPKTKKEWIDALKDYSNLTDANASDVADKFRKALERFFQEFFNTTKTLENLKSEYGNYMKSKGVPPEISNNLETLQQCYTNFMNNYAKHHDKTSENLLEYIMYQTGNIIRLLITLK